MNYIFRIKSSLRNRWAYSSPKRYIRFLKNKGISIGKNFKIRAYGSLRNIVIDTTRPSLVTIGDNVSINKNFTLLTHDFVSGIFINYYDCFLPSSGHIKIGNNVRFGVNCTVLKGVTIGDNCFIGAGSIVTKDIPANSIAVGAPCKVVMTLDEYFNKRKEQCEAEALEYALSIKERFGRTPVPSDFWEEFPLFVSGDEIDKYPEIPIRKQLGKAFDKYMKFHKAKYPSFDAFVDAALNNKQ